MTHPAARRAIAANVRKALLVVAIGRAERHFLDRLVNDETLKRHKETKKNNAYNKNLQKKEKGGCGDMQPPLDASLETRTPTAGCRHRRKTRNTKVNQQLQQKRFRQPGESQE